MADELEKKTDDVFDDSDYEAAFRDAAGVDENLPPADPEPPALPEDEPTDTSAQSDSEPAPVVVTEEPKTSPEMASIEAQLTKMESLLAEATKRAPEKPAKEEPPARTPQDDEDDAVLKTVQEDWPTIYRAMEVRIKELEQRLLAAVSGVETKIKGEFAPVTQSVVESAQERFLSTINAAHPDSKVLLPKVEEWIAVQPRFLQTAYNAALDTGTAQDVIELYNTFKQATGVSTPPPSSDGNAPPAGKDKQKRLDQMEGVKTERTSTTTISDDDFEGAFERAARAH